MKQPKFVKNRSWKELRKKMITENDGDELKTLIRKEFDALEIMRKWFLWFLNLKTTKKKPQNFQR